MTTAGVVVLHYRNWPAVADCIRSVLAQGVPPASVCVVDNASGDGSVAHIASAFPAVASIALAENRGYAAGMNAGAAHFGDVDHVLLVTHDCVLADGALHALERAIDADERVGAVGPLLAFRSDPTRVFSAGGTTYGRRLATGHTSAGEPVERWLGAPPRDVAFLDGSCLLVRTRMLRDLGGFDEQYFMYYEESDLGRRATAQGWRFVCTRDALAYQDPGPRPEALWTRNRLRFLRRNGGIPVAMEQALVDLAGVARRIVSSDPAVRASAVRRLRGLLAPVVRTPPDRLYRLG